MAVRRRPNRRDRGEVTMDRSDAGGVPALATLARLLADDTRARFCMALMDGRAWTASELARHAGVARSTASEHLSQLIAGGLLREHRQGRHRYVQLIDAETASLLETLASAAPPPTGSASTLSGAVRRRTVAFARTCYDHLAGALGVAIADAMVRRSLLTDDGALTLTSQGADWLNGLGIGLAESRRRPPTRACLDWTERRVHLGGAAGAGLCDHAIRAGWVHRVPNSRAVRITDAGRRCFLEHLGLRTEALVPPGQG